ncbi:hypothetical protein K7432_007156 [Basidiobolus ranarum]|uniref:Uncharacterized protein n=1 Tax=Basidiobolus ranarum TaxID=34480 RepID=A0ABR2WTW2_9FUNG
MSFIQRLLPVSKSTTNSIPITYRLAGKWGSVSQRSIFATNSFYSTKEEDEWEDVPRNIQSINFSQNHTSASGEAGSIRSTSASGLDLTPNLLVQQMLFNDNSKPQERVTAGQGDDDDEYFISSAPAHFLFNSSPTVDHSI